MHNPSPLYFHLVELTGNTTSVQHSIPVSPPLSNLSSIHKFPNPRDNPPPPHRIQKRSVTDWSHNEESIKGAKKKAKLFYLFPYPYIFLLSNWNQSFFAEKNSFSLFYRSPVSWCCFDLLIHFILLWEGQGSSFLLDRGWRLTWPPSPFSIWL